MLVENTTPFAALGFEQWHRDGQTMAVVAARGRFRLSDDGKTVSADESVFVLADEFADTPHNSDLTRTGDLVPFKPAADISFLGSIHAVEPQESILAGIQIGKHVSVVRACGARSWTYQKAGWTLTRPDPIDVAFLTYRQASGGRIIGDPDGRVDPRNPIGPGLIDTEYTPTTKEYPAPTIDSEHVPVARDHATAAEPQGFGPIPPWWLARQRFAGTYDAAWKDKVHPRLPRDFDYRFYQTAHPGLILPGYLAGDELVETVGLVPGGDYLRFRLPGLAAWARFSFTDGRQVQAAMNLDGLHLDFRDGNRIFDLTWRAWIEICPAFYRVDLHHGPLAKIREANLPVAGLHGLEEGA